MDQLLPPVFKDERKRIFLNAEGADKPLKSPLPRDVVERARAYRLGRIRKGLVETDCAAALLYDPVNIRYALDSPNMQVWSLHNPVRYALVFAERPALLFDYKGAEHHSKHLKAIDAAKPATSWIYVMAGDKSSEQAVKWAAEIGDLMRQHGGGNKRIAVDRLDVEGVRALEKIGIEVVDGTPMTEAARSIKSADEIALMRWTIRVCEAGMARIYEHSVPGVTEQELWAHLHFENARSGGDWLETKILTCGPNTNPWYGECSDRLCREGEMIAFDTDMIGPYGYCADLSRSWTCGYTRMTPKQAEHYAAAVEQIEHNISILRAGLDFRAFNEKSWRIPERYQPYRYSLAVHGVGMADEWPIVLCHTDFEHNQGGRFEAGMVVCVESLISEAGCESIKLETQVLITEKGPERLDQFPWERL
ncbi:M24 family metallopeptidase [Rhizobium sp. LjRoot254]|uniref:M24 family metallopeptidase n=1 Tax=Rhizobium sp. LjRoot254 TaxID=3342297 RepID=UPI003ECE8413